MWKVKWYNSKWYEVDVKTAAYISLRHKSVAVMLT